VTVRGKKKKKTRMAPQKKPWMKSLSTQRPGKKGLKKKPKKKVTPGERSRKVSGRKNNRRMSKTAAVTRVQGTKGEKSTGNP